MLERRTVMRSWTLPVAFALSLAAGCTSSGSETGTHHCDGNDETFGGDEGPCPATGTVVGVVRGIGGPSPGLTITPAPEPPTTFRLSRAGQLVVARKAQPGGGFTFSVRPGRYAVTATAFGGTCALTRVRLVAGRTVH